MCGHILPWARWDITDYFLGTLALIGQAFLIDITDQAPQQRSLLGRILCVCRTRKTLVQHPQQRA